ncbi:MAG: hypothetical protein HC915_19270, partial [Anaerolineae bacterium]|nr:hypothetical protein [Anaerolineae bacterium]
MVVDEAQERGFSLIPIDSIFLPVGTDEACANLPGNATVRIQDIPGPPVSSGQSSGGGGFPIPPVGNSDPSPGENETVIIDRDPGPAARATATT